MTTQIQAQAQAFIDAARAGEVPEISSGCWLMLGQDLLDQCDPEEEHDDLISEQLYTHCNDGSLEAVNLEDVIRIISE